MKRENIIIIWLKWHFYKVPAFLLLVWKNYIFFGLDYFSTPTLIKSFFSPWRKYRWKYPRFTQVGEFIGTFVSNAFSRSIGAILRAVLIVAGILFQIFVLVVGFVVFVFWMLYPFVALILIYFFFA
jgi:hypothetical protein